MLKIENLNKKFGKKSVLEDFSFEFENGVYGLLGPNGAGKTTFIRSLTQIYPTKSGVITYNGVPVIKDDNFLNKIGYLPQQFGMFKDLKVIEMMLLMANLKGVNKNDALPMVKNVVEMVNLSDRLDSKVRALSGGMVRRLGVAQALLNDPKVIVFDEPTAGLDPEERLRFKNIINEIKGDRIIIISTHIVEDVEAVCDKVAIMPSKNIKVCGSCREIQDYAKDKVYEILPERVGEINGRYHVQKYFEKENQKYMKILCSEVQESFEKCDANVEDGYICILQAI